MSFSPSMFRVEPSGTTVGSGELGLRVFGVAEFKSGLRLAQGCRGKSFLKVPRAAQSRAPAPGVSKTTTIPEFVNPNPADV